MLPSIRHLLDSDPAVGQSGSNPTSSSPTSSTTMPSPAHQPFQQKIAPQKQSNMIGAERPRLQHNTSEHRKTQHRPHPPYEPLHPPHLHSHQGYRPSYTRPPVTSQGQSSDHGGHPSGYSEDYDRHRLLNEHQGSSLSPPDPNSQYQKGHTSSSRHSPRSAHYSAEYAADSKRDAHELGAPRFSEWSPKTSGNLQGPTPHHHPPHNPSFSSSYRPQQQRTSPFDPSVCSSSSSDSPSPSISTVAAVITPLTADAIASVTLGTAAATISDARPWYNQNHGSSRMALPQDSGEPTDGYVAPNHHTELSSRWDSEQVLSPTGGLVQPAARYTSHPDSNNRTSYHESVSSSQQLLSPSHADELQDRISSRSSPKQHQDRHPYSSDPYDQRPLYQSLHRYGPSEESFESEQHYGYPTATVNTSNRPHSPARLASSLSPPRLHESRHSPARDHAALPRTRASTAADERMFRDRDGAWHSEQRRGSLNQTQGQGWRRASLSSPGPSGTHSAPPLPDHARQHPSPSCYPPPSSFRSSPYHDHHPSHPSLQQQQQAPPLYDLVRKSDQRTVQYPLSNPSTPLPRADRQALHDQPVQHQDRLHVTSSAMSSVSLESRSPRQAGLPSQSLVTRSSRIASPGPSHPYYASSHPQRSYHSHTNDSDLVIRSSTRGQVKEEESCRQHFHSAPLPQVRSSDTVQGHHSPSTQSHESLHGAVIYEDRNMHIQNQSLGIDRGPDFHERGNGSWSDGGAGAGYEPRTGHKRGGHDNLSESHSVSISSASHWKESERVIRPSLSEPDLTVMDAVQRKRKLAVDPSKDDAEENEEVDNEELEAEEEVDELEEDEESGGHDSYQHPRQPPHSQQGYAYEYGNGSEPAQYSQSPSSRDGQQRPHPPPHFQHPPPPPHSRPQPMHHTHHPQVPSYHGVPVHQQHIYDYPSQPLQGHPPHQAQRNPRAFSHPYISQFQVQLPQYPQQDASSFHSTYPNGHPVDPKAPNRRGPYLSRQRALLAGLETTSPSSRYQCQYCHKRFSRPSSLRIHTYSHTGERPFKCSEEGCGRQFSVQSNMRRHLRVHRLGRMRSEFPSSN